MQNTIKKGTALVIILFLLGYLGSDYIMNNKKVISAEELQQFEDMSKFNKQLGLSGGWELKNR